MNSLRLPRSSTVLWLLLLVAGALPGCATKTAVLPPPGAPHFPDFVQPVPPAPLVDSPGVTEHDLGWRWLQAGDVKEAERHFHAALKSAPAFYPAETGLGYAALAKKDAKSAAAHFEKAIEADAGYAPALAGRGEALLAQGLRAPALESFEAAVAADPQLGDLRNRIAVLRLRGLQDDVATARKAAESGKVDEARKAYLQAIAASPQSPFLYRELAAVERRAGDAAQALQHAEKAVELDPSDARALALVGDIHEEQGHLAQAIDAYTAAAAIEPSEALDRRIDDLRSRTAFEAMPEEFRSIEVAPTVTRAQVAALLGVQLDPLLKSAPRGNPVLMTDTRGSWAAPWIQSVTRAGLMEAFPNHTFQPDATVRRSDFAAIVGRALSLIAESNPERARTWRDARRRFPDLAPTHLVYPAASLAVASGVMQTGPDGEFQPSRPITGAEAVAAGKTLRELSERRPR